MDRPHWPQEIVVKPMEEIVLSNTTNSITNNINLTKPSSSSSSFERKLVRPQKAASVNCPRCDSTNTKFCYYNNYSLSQPRYFCKTCRRYWTEGGTLRNIPVGGGSRKNKRSSSSSTSSLSSLSKKLPDLIVPSGSTLVLSQNPRIHHHDHYGQDLNLGFASTNNFKNVSDFIQVPNFDATMNTNSSPSTTSSTTTTASASAQLSALELLTSITTRGTNTMINGLMPTPIHDHNQVYSTSGQMMFPMPEFKIPSLRFSLDGMTSGGGGVYGSTLNDSMDRRLLFPFEELKTNTSTTTHGDPHVGQEREHNGDSNGFWHGMMGGGSW